MVTIAALFSAGLYPQLKSHLVLGKEHGIIKEKAMEIVTQLAFYCGWPIAKMKEAEVIVVGSPLYWHSICGSVRNVLDRFYGMVENGVFSGRKLIFLFQGAAPEAWMLEKGGYTMSRFARMYGFEYVGMATNKDEAKALSGKI